MGKTKRFLILILLVAGLQLNGQQDRLTFQEVDRHSFELYSKGDWKELARFTRESFKQGFDYYYLRMRAGIACFERKRYLEAALHFKQALAFNDGDITAGEYLYGCFLELNRSREAYAIYEKLPASSRERLRKSLPKLGFASIEEGLVMCNQVDKFDSLDLNGEDNIYGETDMTQDGNYFNAGLSWGFKNGCSIYGGYTFVSLNKNKIAEIGDTLTVDDQYPLRQHQVYINGNIPLSKGYSVLPAFNLVLDRFETVMPRLAPDSASYLLPLETFRYNTFIGYVSVTKDFSIVQTTISAAYSNLNEKTQYQAGFQALVYPFGNLNFYLSSKLISHINEEENNIIFEQMIGLKLFKGTWAELNATFGRMENYHEKNAYVVYNIADVMKFKGGGKLIYMLYPNWIISIEYLLMMREGAYVYYSMLEDNQAVPVTRMKDFSNNIVILGLKWKI